MVVVLILGQLLILGQIDLGQVDTGSSLTWAMFESGQV